MNSRNESKDKMNLSDLVDDEKNHRRVTLAADNYEQTDLCSRAAEWI